MALKLLIVPLETVISALVKSVVVSLAVKVSDKVASSEVSPSVTSAAVITIVGPDASYVQLNWLAAILLFPAGSVKVLPATSMDVAPSAVGVKVAV